MGMALDHRLRQLDMCRYPDTKKFPKIDPFPRVTAQSAHRIGVAPAHQLRQTLSYQQ